MSASGRRDQLSRQRFVVRPAGGDTGNRSLPPLEDITVERLPSPQGGWLVCLHQPAGSPRTGWQRLQQRLGADLVVVPVMDEGDGSERYPTGLVSVRFGAPLSDPEMQAFARAHHLEVVRRARFTKVQALFRPTDIGQQFLPDIVEKLSATADADAVWLDTESAYTRSA